VKDRISPVLEPGAAKRGNGALGRQLGAAWDQT